MSIILDWVRGEQMTKEQIEAIVEYIDARFARESEMRVSYSMRNEVVEKEFWEAYENLFAALGSDSRALREGK